MSEIKRLENRPSLKLVLSLLGQKKTSAVDWFLYYLSSKDLLTPHSLHIEQNAEVFHEASKLFVGDIKLICESASPDKNPKPLLQYLRQGRGLILLAGLRKILYVTPVFNDELCAVLLSLHSFLINLDATCLSDGERCDLFSQVPTPACPRVLTKFSRKKKFAASARTRRRKR